MKHLEPQHMLGLRVMSKKGLDAYFGSVTPQYVYRMWGGTVALEDIEAGLKEIKNGCR